MPVIATGNPLNGTDDDDVILDLAWNSNPHNRLYGRGGNDLLLADWPSFYAGWGASFGTAVNLTSFEFTWTLTEDNEILDSTSIAHTSALFAPNAATDAYYQVFVTAGSTITLDVDLSGETTDTVVEIYASDRVTLLALNDNSSVADGGFGSISGRDSFLQYTFAAAGQYYIRVREADGLFEAGDRFVLNASLTGQAQSGGAAVGNDTLSGGSGTDMMSARGGDDLLQVAYGDITSNEYYNGGSGNDTLEGSGTNFYDLDFTTSTVLSIETIDYTALEETGVAIFRFAASQFGFGSTGGLGSALVNFSGSDTTFDIFLVSTFDSPSVNLNFLTFANVGASDYVGISGDGDNETIFGSTIRDVIISNGGADTLTGSLGLDSVQGGAGNDVLVVFSGDLVAGETYDGGADSDTLSGDHVFGAYDFDFTTSTVLNFETLRFESPGASGTSIMRFAAAQIGPGIAANASVVFEGFAGVTEILEVQMLGSSSVNLSQLSFATGAATGTVRVVGDGDSETIIGSAIGDILEGNGGSDNLYGGLGADRHIGGDDGSIDFARYDDANYGSLTIRLDGGVGTGAAQGDFFQGIEGVVAGAGWDTIYGNGEGNYLLGMGGTDAIRGGGGNDTLDGGEGSDHLYGGAGADRLVGGDGAAIDYARYDDADYGGLTIRLDGGAGTGAAQGDVYVGIEGLVGGAGTDSIYGNGAANHLLGKGGTDSIRGGAGGDTLDGGDGTDHLFGGADADRLIGGEGRDYARYDDAAWGNIVIRLDGGAGTGAAAGDTYSSVEGVIGGSGNDTIFGSTGDNHLLGGHGNDFFSGNTGNDTIDGGWGADRIRFSTALSATNVDTIVGFQHDFDKIELSRSIFASIGTTLTADEFGSAADPNNFIIYQQGTGRLLYDAGGSGSGPGPILFATVAAGTMLDVGDFTMI